MDFYQNLSLNDLQNEVWRDVPNYEGFYQVSNLPRVKSFPRKHQLLTKIVSQHPTGGGYLTVTFTKDRQRKNFRVHKLVALCFIEEVDGLDEINHIDENKFNNCVENLMRCNRGYNVNYGCRNLLVGYKLMNRPDHSKPVLQIDANGNILRRFRSAHDAGRFYKCKFGSIARVCRGERNNYKGMFFKYE